jgi:Zn-dependent metalloprotease
MGFNQLHEHADEDDAYRDAGARAESDEQAARTYIDIAMQRHGGAGEFFDIVVPGEAALVPGLTHDDTQSAPVGENRVIRFHQRYKGIPVFGSRTVVEITENRGFVSLDSSTAPIEGEPVAELSPAQAVEALVKQLGITGFTPQQAPELTYFEVADDRFALTYLVQRVPAGPPGEATQPSAEIAAITLDTGRPRTYDYLVDAQTGAIVFSYARGPALDVVATDLWGFDDEGERQEFQGRIFGDGFEMSDPDRKVVTHDANYGLVPDPLPPPVACTTADWGKTNRAAVSAHVNATRVHDFFEGVLHRKSVDDKGLPLVSVVNVIRKAGITPPVWKNAFWDQDDFRMVYGQIESDGTLASLATYLDVIGHELTHGITQFTADLVYKDQPGALNESMSDIFGVIIANWYLKEGADVDDWDWEIGAGLGDGGGSLRHAADPASRGMPAHMRDYRVRTDDDGGVHYNSSIHTLAAVNLLRSKVFPPRKVAEFYYATLQRLGRLATFADARDVLVQVVATRRAGEDDGGTAAIAAVKAAYDKVGIGSP